MTKKLPFVVVEWVDACSSNEWRGLDDPWWAKPPGLVLSSGWLVNDAAEFVVLAATSTPDGEQATGDMTIPRGAIRRTHHVSLPKAVPAVRRPVGTDSK